MKRFKLFFLLLPLSLLGESPLFLFELQNGERISGTFLEEELVFVDGWQQEVYPVSELVELEISDSWVAREPYLHLKSPRKRLAWSEVVKITRQGEINPLKSATAEVIAIQYKKPKKVKKQKEKKKREEKKENDQIPWLNDISSLLSALEKLQEESHNSKLEIAFLEASFDKLQSAQANKDQELEAAKKALDKALEKEKRSQELLDERDEKIGKLKQELNHKQKTLDNIYQQLTGSQKAPAKRHHVQEGESLSKISKQYYGTPNLWENILEANKDQITRKDEIRPGQMLLIP